MTLLSLKLNHLQSVANFKEKKNLIKKHLGYIFRKAQDMCKLSILWSKSFFTRIKKFRYSTGETIGVVVISQHNVLNHSDDSKNVFEILETIQCCQNMFVENRKVTTIHHHLY